MTRKNSKLLKYVLSAALIFFVILGTLLILDRLNIKDIRRSSTLKRDTVIYVDSVLQDNPLVVGIQIVSVDLQTNTRYIVHTSIYDKVVEDMYISFINKTITVVVPVFIKDDDVSNSRMIRIINHQFDCSPFKETISYRYVPEAAPFISTTCSISIPPSYGEFKGIIGVHLRKPPTDVEKDRMRILIKEIAERVAPELKKD